MSVAPLSLARSMARWLRRVLAAFCHSAALPFWVSLREGRDVAYRIVPGQLRKGRPHNLFRQAPRLEVRALSHRGLNLLAVEPFRLGLQYLLLLFALISELQPNQPDDRVRQRDEEDYQQHRDEDRHRPPIYPFQLERVELN